LRFGSLAVFPEAKFLLLADTTGELIDNRRGDVVVHADVKTSIDALSDALK